MIKNNSLYEKLFLFAGIYNIGASIIFIFGYRFLFPLINMNNPLFPSFMFLAFVFVFVFGIGYLIISKDLHKNHDIVRLGILSKVLAFFVIFHGCFINVLPVIFYGAAIIDLIWATAFINFIYKGFNT